MAEGGFQIATAYVTVTADTEALEADIQAAADASGATADVPAVADTEALAADIQAAADATGATADVPAIADTEDLAADIQAGADATGATADVPVIADTEDLAGQIQAGADETGATAQVPVIADTEDLAAQIQAGADESGATAQVPVVADTEDLAAQIDTAADETGATVQVPVVPDTEGLAAEIDTAADETGAAAQVPVVPDTEGLAAAVQAAADETGATVTVPVIPDTADLAAAVDTAAAETGATVTVPVVPDTADLAALVDTAAAETGATVTVPVVPDTEGLAALVDTAAAETGATATVPVVADTEGLAAQIDAAVATSGATATVMVDPDVAGFPEKLDAAVAGTPATALVKVEPDPASMAAFKEKTTAESETAGAESGAGFGTKFGTAVAGAPLMDGAKGKLAADAEESGTESGGGFASKFSSFLSDFSLFGGETKAKLDAAAESSGGESGSGFASKFSALLGGVPESPELVKMRESLAAKGEESGTESGGKFASKFGDKAGEVPESSAIGKMGENLGDKGVEAGQEYGGSFGGSVMKKITEFGLPVAIAAGIGAVAVHFGEMLETSQMGLEGALKTVGLSWDNYSAKIDAAGQKMSKFGFTQDQVDTSLASVVRITESMKDALASEGTIADIAATKHISLADATTIFTQSLAGAGKGLKQMGVIQASGATEAKAMATAQTTLADQVTQAGGMAKFAAQHNITLAAAQKLVSGASKGNIADFNKLGIEVLPKTATAADKFAQVNTLLASKMGDSAAAAADTFGGKLETVKAKLEDVAEKLGVKLMPYLSDFVTWVEHLIHDLEPLAKALADVALPVVSAFFKGLVDTVKFLLGPVKDITFGILGVVAAMKAWAIVNDLMVGGMKMLGVAAGMTDTELGALTITEKLQALWEGVVSVATKAWAAAQAILNAIMDLNPFVAITAAVLILAAIIIKYHKQIFDVIEKTWKDVAAFVPKIWDDIYGFIKKALDKIVSAIENWTLVGLIIKYHKQILDAITDAWNAIYSFFSKIIDKITGFFKTSWDKIWSDIKSVWKSISDWFTTWWNTLYTWFSNIIAKIISFFKTSWNTIWNDIKSIWASISSWFTTWWNTLYTWFSNIIAKIISFFKTSWNTIWSDAKSLWASIWSWFQGWWNTLYSWVSGIIGKVISFFKTSWNTIWNDIKSVWASIYSWFQGWWNTLVSWVKGVLATFRTDLKGAWADIKSDANLAWTDLEKIFSKPVEFLVNTVYDKGIARLWNDTVAKLGGPTIPTFTFSGAAAKGGKITQGTGPKSDDVLARVSKNETVVSAEHSRALAPVFAAIGVPGYALGGIPNPITAITGLVKDVVGGAADLAKLTAAVASGNKTAFANALENMLGNKGSGGAEGAFAATVAGAPVKIIDAMVGAAWKAIVAGAAPKGGGAGGKIPAGGLGPANLRQIEDWWTGAGGPGGGIAHIAAAITGAESGFNTQAVQQGEPYATTGWGLWQITPGDSEPQFGINQALLTGPSNAGAAVAKYQGAGGFSPWTTYEDGAYLAFMDQGGWLMPGKTVVHNNTGVPERVVPPGGGGGGVTVNFNGVQFPSPEQVQALSLALSSAVGVAG